MTPLHSTPTAPTTPTALTPPPLITLLTDFGTTDYYVGAVKGVLLSRVPGASLVDLSHEVPPGSIETGAFLLGAAAPAFPRGTVHLAVVDPGVGSARRILAVETPDARFVGPDNGLLEPALGHGEARVFAVHRPDLYRDPLGETPRRAAGQTFHGRDRFAPVAAALAAGEAIESLGEAIRDARRLAAPAPRRQGREATGRVVHIDRFGNLVTDIPSAWMDGPLDRAEVGADREGTAGGASIHRTARRVTHYAEIPPGEAALLPGSLGTEELSLPGESLAERWGITIGAPVRIYLR